jgi:hypothetical protein
LNHASPSLRGLRGSLRGELNERLAACQAASRALGVVPGGAGWHEEKSAFKILILTGSGGLTLGRAGFAPAGRQTKFHEGIASSNSL